MKSVLCLVLLSSILIISGCNASKEKEETEVSNLNNKTGEQEREIEELKEEIVTINEEIGKIFWRRRVFTFFG